MVNLPWPLALRSQLVPHKLTTVFYPGTFLGGGLGIFPPTEGAEESKICHDFKIMFMN